MIQKQMTLLFCPFCTYPSNCPCMPFDALVCPKCHREINSTDWRMRVSYFSLLTNKLFWLLLQIVFFLLVNIFRPHPVWDG